MQPLSTSKNHEERVLFMKIQKLMGMQEIDTYIRKKILKPDI